MAGLNISLGYFFVVVALCDVLRRVSKRRLPSVVHSTFLRELASSFQLCACCLELRMLVEIGAWGGGFGADVTMTLLFLLFLVHGATFDGASANPTVSLQQFLQVDSSLLGTTLQIMGQFAGCEAARAGARLYWSWELTDLHIIQNMMASDCSSSLRTSVSQGVFVEGVCAFLFHLALLRFQHSSPTYRVPIIASLVTLLAYTAGSYTSAFFNPALAYSVTFQCSGNSLKEYMMVYWISPCIGEYKRCAPNSLRALSLSGLDVM
nr:PREDICTED: aquaporin-12-like [Latimeria chalumnae]|eukprot:XP_006009788.1 PREDICTED: aquaporin-12-like [Latimeria chalumnae]